MEGKLNKAKQTVEEHDQRKNQRQGGNTVEGKDANQAQAAHIQPTQNKAAIRALISDDARQRSERSDDETERRNERTENRDRKICDHEQTDSN